MASKQRSAAIDDALARIAARSEDAHGEVLAASPVIARYGAAALLEWLDACAELVAHDPEGGRALHPRQRRRCGGRRGSACPGPRRHAASPAGAGRLRRSRASWRSCRRRSDRSVTPDSGGGQRSASSGAGVTWRAALPTSQRRSETSPRGRGSPVSTRSRPRPRNSSSGAISCSRPTCRVPCGCAICSATLPSCPGRCAGAMCCRATGCAARRIFVSSRKKAWGSCSTATPVFACAIASGSSRCCRTRGSAPRSRSSASGWSPERGRPFVEADARAVYLPLMLPSREEAVLGSLHAAGHLHYGTFDLDALRRLAGAGVDPNTPLEGLLQFLLAPWQDDLARFLLCFDLCEDLRVDACLGAAVPNYLARLERLAPCTASTSWTAAMAYRTLALQSLRLARGHSDHGLAPQVAQRLAPLLDPAATVADAFSCARWLHTHGMLPRVPEDEFAEAYLPARGPNLSRVLPQRKAQDGAHGTGDTAQPSEPQPANPQGGGEGAQPNLQHDPAAAEAGAVGARTADATVPSRGDACAAGAIESARSPVSGVGLSRGTLQARLGVGAGAGAHRAQRCGGRAHRCASPAHAAAVEACDAGAEADASGAAAQAVRRRGRRPRRRSRLRRGVAGRMGAGRGGVPAAGAVAARYLGHPAGGSVDFDHAARAARWRSARRPGARRHPALCREPGGGR